MFAGVHQDLLSNSGTRRWPALAPPYEAEGCHHTRHLYLPKIGRYGGLILTEMEERLLA
jgi:hypothetical protein